MGFLDKFFHKKPAFDQGETDANPLMTPIEIFARNFTNNGGKFLLAKNDKEIQILLKAILMEEEKERFFYTDETVKNALLQELPHTSNLKDGDIFVSFTEHLIKEMGGIMISSIHTDGLSVSDFPKTVVFIARPTQLVNDLEEGMAIINQRFKQLNTPPPQVHTLNHFNENPEDVYRKNAYLILLHE